MNKELPEGWTLSEPTLIFHGKWYRARFNGVPTSMILIHGDSGYWYRQNGKKSFDSAADAITAAVEAAGITMD